MFEEKNKAQRLQTELDVSEQVQRDFVKLSQTLQVRCLGNCHGLCGRGHRCSWRSLIASATPSDILSLKHKLGLLQIWPPSPFPSTLPISALSISGVGIGGGTGEAGYQSVI